MATHYTAALDPVLEAEEDVFERLVQKFRESSDHWACINITDKEMNAAIGNPSTPAVIAPATDNLTAEIRRALGNQRVEVFVQRASHSHSAGLVAFEPTQI